MILVSAPFCIWISQPYSFKPEGWLSTGQASLNVLEISLEMLTHLFRLPCILFYFYITNENYNTTYVRTRTILHLCCEGCRFYCQQCYWLHWPTLRLISLSCVWWAEIEAAKQRNCLIFLPSPAFITTATSSHHFFLPLQTYTDT